MMHRKGLGAEHPFNDMEQAVFLAVFSAVWILDSFVFRFSAVFAGVVPLLVGVPLGILCFVVGVYLVIKSEALVFNRGGTDAKLINSGVYGRVRHPMYLGSLLFLLGFFFTTFSLLSLLVWVGLFIFYDRMATYEEQDLSRILGEQYLDYQRRVPKWFPRPMRGRE
jgi:protein-S-isoprenylcysteine O-methyltransferase Ste14